MILNMLIAVVVLIVVFVVIVASRPCEKSVTRTILISAPPLVLFPKINDLHQFQEWSPYLKMDPAQKHTFEGPAAGIGSSMTWAGNKNVGEGRMTLIENHPDDLVKYRLDFKKPFVGTSIAEFTLKPQGNQTAVTWCLLSKHNFLMKAVGLFMDLDKMIGSQFEMGLNNLKSLAESANKK